MKKLVYILLSAICSYNAFADSAESTPLNTQKESAPIVVAAVPAYPNAGTIGRYNYAQNPYGWMMSGGGTLILTESQIAQQNWAEKLFAGGTYNVYAGATYNQWDGTYASSGKSYGANIFGQTGQLGGFSIGGVFSAMNPIGQLNNDINPTTYYSRYSSGYIPTFTSYTLPEAFLEYQYGNIVNVDLGYVAFDNSPWLAGNAYTNMLTVPTTYQGIGVNVYAGSGWLLSALAFNGAQFGAQQGFTGNTNYSWLSMNPGYNNNSNGTVSVGANYASTDNNYNLRMWGYQFDNYGTLLYGDTGLTIPVNKSLSFNLSAQFASDQQWFQANNAMSQSSNAQYAGNIQSYAAGIKAGMTYGLFSLNASANTMWGPSGSSSGGALVSPYTQSLQVDPMYSEAWSYNQVTTAQAGNMYKLAGQFALGGWGQNLIFQPNYIYVANNNVTSNGLQEMDLVLNYPIPQVRGLYIFGVYAQQWYAQNAIGVTNNNYQPIEIQSGVYYTW